MPRFDELVPLASFRTSKDASLPGRYMDSGYKDCIGYKCFERHT
jgi:hypothetical protein